MPKMWGWLWASSQTACWECRGEKDSGSPFKKRALFWLSLLVPLVTSTTSIPSLSTPNLLTELNSLPILSQRKSLKYKSGSASSGPFIQLLRWALESLVGCTRPCVINPPPLSHIFKGHSPHSQYLGLPSATHSSSLAWHRHRTWNVLPLILFA